MALIQPAALRYGEMKVVRICSQIAGNKGGTAYTTSLAIGILQGTFCAPADFLKGEDYEDHFEGRLREGV